MKNNNNDFQGIYLREEMGFEPDIGEIEKNDKKKKKQNKSNGKNKTHKDNNK